jgi:hypothetical protein
MGQDTHIYNEMILHEKLSVSFFTLLQIIHLLREYYIYTRRYVYKTQPRMMNVGRTSGVFENLPVADVLIFYFALTCLLS